MSEKKPLLKLYILIRKDLSKEQQAVQAGHTVAKFQNDHPESGWTNGTLIYLHVKDSKSFDLWSAIIRRMYESSKSEKPKTGFYVDPSIHGQMVNSMYAYHEDCELLFRDLPLMRF